MATGGRRKSGRIFILLAIILILILAAVVVVFRTTLFPGSGSNGPAAVATAPPPIETVAVVILSQPVKKGEVITSEKIEVIQYPRSAMAYEGMMISDPNMVINKIAKYDLEQGIPMTNGFLTETPPNSYAAMSIPRNMVAVSIPISRLTSVAFAPQPGDHVNIIASIMLADVDPNFQSRLPNFTGSVLAPGPVTSENSSGNSVVALLTSGGDSSKQGRTELDPVLNQPLYVQPSETQRPRLVSQTIVQDSIVLWVGNFPLDGSINMVSEPTPTPDPAAAQDQAPPAAILNPDIITLVVSPQDSVTLVDANRITAEPCPAQCG
jgi:Flp pilus assembly protein CpaB